jgi:multicomponent Na+:H+ antiporter subunit G
MSISEWVSLVLTGLGAFFFFAGTVGVLRFPDVYTRLHALTKADGLGVGLVVMGLAVQTTSWMVVTKLMVIWLLVMFSSATSCHLVARAARQAGIQPWRRP